MKIVINNCYGGFSLSKKAFAQYCIETGTNPKAVGVEEMPRDNPVLVRIVEEMGEDAGGDCRHSSIPSWLQKPTRRCCSPTSQ